MDFQRPADAIVAFPPVGVRYAMWEEQVAQARLSALAQFAEFCPGLGLHDFLSLRPDTQRHVLLTPEYGQWASWMKRRLVARNPQADGPRAEDLRRQFQYFLLAGYLRQP